MASFLSYLHRVAAGEDLIGEDAQAAMNALLEGEATAAQIAAFAVAIKMKGETAAEVTGFARALREHMIVVDAGAGLIDTCGTGGDLFGDIQHLNRRGIRHGGRGSPRGKAWWAIGHQRDGSADVLEALGIRISMTPEEAAARFARSGSDSCLRPTSIRR